MPVERQHVDQRGGGRPLERGQLAAAVLEDVGAAMPLPARRHRDHDGRLAPAVVRDADDDGADDARVLAGDRLDLGRGDVQAAADDQVLQPAR